MELPNVRLLRRGQILREWWTEVKENFWEQDARPQVKTLVKELMEQTLLEEIHRHRESYALKEAPYRNGYYERNLVTQFGSIEDLRVPRLREGRFRTRVFERYKRYQNVVEDLVEGIFLAGVSTRRVGEALSKLLESEISASTVSRITRRLDGKVGAFHKRALIDEYQYLILDGINLKIRHNAKYHNRRVLVAYGMTVFGRKELIDFKQAQGESQEAWEVLLHTLYQRGLEGKHLKLMVMDGAAGLKAACELVYPHVRIQRCWAHKLRNVAGYCRKKYEGDCLKQAKRIYLAKDRAASIREFKCWKEAWQRLWPNAVHCLEKDLEDLLAFLDCPRAHQIRVRTTNAIERSFREVRRRTRVFSCFSNTASSERIIFAILTHLNNNWKAKPLKQFTQFI